MVPARAMVSPPVDADADAEHHDRVGLPLRDQSEDHWNAVFRRRLFNAPCLYARLGQYDV